MALSGGAPEQAPRWDLMDTESCDGGIWFLAPSLIVWGYIGIYRRKKYVGGASVGPRGWGHALYLMPSSKLPWRRVQVSGVIFGKKIMF